MRLLIVEDDDIIIKNLKALLTSAAYAVDTATDLQEGTDKALSGEYDLCLIDWMLPDGDGTSLIQTLRDHNLVTPVLMLTAKSQKEDVVAGLDVGADDYIAKPYEAEVLLARIRALLRRQTTIVDPVLSAGNLMVDTNSHTVTVLMEEVQLTAREFALLEYLIRNKNIACSRADLFTHVWDEQANMLSNSVDVYIRFIRKKLGDLCTAPIQTIKGFGYKLCDP